MRRVENEVFYHLNSKGTQNPYKLLEEGDIIDIGKNINPFMLSYEYSSPKLRDTNKSGASIDIWTQVS